MESGKHFMPPGFHDGIVRHDDNGKWYGLIMDVRREKLGLPGEGYMDILNVKLNDPMYRVQGHGDEYSLQLSGRQTEYQGPDENQAVETLPAGCIYVRNAEEYGIYAVRGPRGGIPNSLSAALKKQAVRK